MLPPKYWRYSTAANMLPANTGGILRHDRHVARKYWLDSGAWPKLFPLYWQNSETTRPPNVLANALKFTMDRADRRMRTRRVHQEVAKSDDTFIYVCMYVCT